MSDFDQTVQSWLSGAATYSPEMWQALNQTYGPFSFITTSLEADAALWGSFWQGDVIAAGYILPASELFFLRVTRLDNVFHDFPLQEMTSDAFQETLMQLLSQPPDGVWATRLISQLVLCLAYQTEDLPWLIWLSDGRIMAAYQDHVDSSPGYNLTTLKPYQSPQNTMLQTHDIDQDALTHLPEWSQSWVKLDRPTQLDRLIQLHRLYSHLKDTSAKIHLRDWLKAHQ
jgi:hypothetical protein